MELEFSTFPQAVKIPSVNSIRLSDFINYFFNAGGLPETTCTGRPASYSVIVA